MTRVLVTGAAGLLGASLVKHAPQQHTVAGVTRRDADLADRDKVFALFDRYRPEVVIHTAYGKADPELDIVVASSNVVDGCLEIGAGLIHLSSDVVFGGEDGPYGEHDAPAPVSPYGEAKAAVEAMIAERFAEAAIVRTSLICSLRPPDPRTAEVLEALADSRPITLFTDELRCPVRLDDLTNAIWELAALPARSRAGVWHVVGPEAVSRYTLGVLIASSAGLDAREILAGSCRDAAEPRPADTRLTTRATDVVLRTEMRPIATLFAPQPRARRRRP